MSLDEMHVDSELRFNIPDIGKQVFAAKYIDDVRGSMLSDEVVSAKESIDPLVLNEEIARYIPSAALEILRSNHLDPCLVFMLPSLICCHPHLLGYYRLLLGISQKQFYRGSTGLGRFKKLETHGSLRGISSIEVEGLCESINERSAQLLSSLDQDSIEFDVQVLPYITLGAQIDGSWRTAIGQSATDRVFNAIKAIVRESNHTFVETESSMTVENDSGRQVRLLLSPDPDVVIFEDFADETVYKVAIEIKGGKDIANIHNRAGEAEKSHQKARANGASDCWTVISLQSVNAATLHAESPTTRQWFDLGEVIDMKGDSWSKLVHLVRSSMGI